MKTRVQQKELKQKENHDTKKRLRRFAPGDNVFIRNYSYRPKWIPAVIIVSSSGPVSYTVTIRSGQTMKRHVDQIRARLTVNVPREPDTELKLLPDMEASSEGCLPSMMEITLQPPTDEPQELQPAPRTQAQPEPPVAPVLQRSQRERRSPVHLKDFVR